MKKISILSATILALILIFSSGCEDEKSGANGRLVIKITDAPFPFELISEANVTITKIEARIADKGDEHPYVVLSTDTMSFNLMDLRNGITAELAEIEIESGTYDLIRLYTGDASIVTSEGEVFDMKVPSGPQTGIKLFIEPALRIDGGLTEELILDFDLSRSFVLKGNAYTPAGIKGFNFKPVIRVINSSTTGRVEGMVKDTASVVVGNASVWVENDTVVATTFSDTTGYYNIIGIPTGMYTIFCTKENYDTVYQDLVIIEANRTTKNFVLTPKQ